jgi:hypothetical protein
MTKSYTFLGPQGEPIPCKTAEEVRSLEARAETRKRKVEHAVEEEKTCPTCGQEIVDDEDLSDDEKE